MRSISIRERLTSCAVAVAASVAVLSPSFDQSVSTTDKAQHPVASLAPAAGEYNQSPTPQDCVSGLYDTVCTSAGNAELQSIPNPAVIPQVPQAQTMAPWVVFGNPGIGYH